MPEARATALDQASCLHTAPTPARHPGRAPSILENQESPVNRTPSQLPLEWRGFQRGHTLGLRSQSCPTELGLLWPGWPPPSPCCQRPWLRQPAPPGYRRSGVGNLGKLHRTRAEGAAWRTKSNQLFLPRKRPCWKP